MAHIKKNYTFGKSCNTVSCSMDSPSINYSFPILPGRTAAEGSGKFTETCQKEGLQPGGYLLYCKLYPDSSSILIHLSVSI